MDAARLGASLEWLANVSSTQLADAAVSVETLSNDLSLIHI